MDDVRANPDAILKKINQEAIGESKGHLKIFFGYAAGVGKTYAMLKAAQTAKEQGADVVVGYVEPHTRPQTTALLEGLECLAPLSVKYKEIYLREFDLDGAIRRKPQLILVDELAHSNGEGCRHKKRYQDILELLKAGIDVYTTVNVQHIESLNDIVASITGIMVRERIPDRIFDEAEQVELVDIEPADLIERLNEGKIYEQTRAKKALGNFFSVENLVALREIALRRCADRVNRVAEKARAAQGSHYYTEEHILVCLSSSPTNPKIIRTASRMASAFKGRFTALFVETPDMQAMGEEDKKRLRTNIALAEQLGATIESVHGDDVAFQIAEFARLSGVSKIVVGRNNTRRKYTFGKPSLTERLTLAAPNLDVYIIPDKEGTKYRPPKAKGFSFQFVPLDIVKSVGLLVLATLIADVFYMLGFSEATIITVYILSVLLTAMVTTERIYSLISSVISVLTFNFFFTYPRFSLEAYDDGYPITFLIMFISAFLTGALAAKIKQNAKQFARTAYRTKVLLETNQLLQKEKDQDAVAAVTANQLIKLLEKDIVFYCVENNELTAPVFFPFTAEKTSKEYVSENEKAVAAWVFKNNKHAGATTNTLGSAKCLYLALRVNDAVYGVVGIVMEEDTPLDSFEHSILLSIIGECALAMENQKVYREREETEILARNEQLRANLLRSISHDLRTPLTAISGNAGILLSNEDAIEKEKRKVLYADIYDDALWLINLVENLLSVTRIEDGSMKLQLSPELMEEVVAEALRHINRRRVEHKITVIQPEECIVVKMDARLIIQVVINIVDNAIKYTPENSEIVIHVEKVKKQAVIRISDDGGGVSDEGKARIFDMFYTAGTQIADSRRSLGLGLALCKSIIMAHGGTIVVKDNVPHGTVFEFTLPIEEVVLRE